MMRHVNYRPPTPQLGFALMGRAMGLCTLVTAARTTCCSSAA
jgi:hypothetical protein